MTMELIRRLSFVGGLLIAVLCLSVGPAAAQGTGFYAGGSIGQTSVDVCDDLNGLGLTSCDDKDTGFKLFGGYNFNQNFGVEIGFVDLGEITATGPGGTARLESDGFQAVAVGIIPINPQFGVFGKLGLFMWDVTASGPGGSLSDDGTDIMFGAGVAWRFTPQLSLRGEWERFDFDGDDVDMLSVGLQFNF